MERPALFARIGWMKYYRGPQPGDERPQRGGKYTKSNIGHEAFNFKPINGRLFGYFQPQMQASTIALERIVPGTTANALHNVLVIFVASDPDRGGQTVVGWYGNATAHRYPQPGQPQRKRFSFFLETSAADAVLLPTHLRTCVVPGGKGGFGRANICYLFEKYGTPKRMPWAGGVLDFVQDHQRENLLTSPEAQDAPSVVEAVEAQLERAVGFQPNSKVRKAIELHAMKVAERIFRERGYSVKDVSRTQPYDLLCRNREEEKYVEVKGTQSDGNAVALTVREMEFASARKAKCVLCVVHGIEVTGRARPKAAGGKWRLLEPFDITKGELKPIAYTFRLP